MCGIVGLINLSKNAKCFSSETFVDINSAMNVQKHRGPDDQGVCGFSFNQNKSIFFRSALDLKSDSELDGVIGFNRLSIKDLSLLGRQPMTALDGEVILAFNGEIYNDVELREELVSKGHSFRSTSDTEVVLKLYLDLGFEEMLKKLNGMFAIVIVDLKQSRIFMVRDRYGIKPLYYSFYKGRIVFASELKSIIQFHDFERVLDIDAFNARLIFSRASDKVLLSGVKMLDPGQALMLTPDGNVEYIKYYNIDNYERVKFEDTKLDEVIGEAEYVLSDVIKRQMVSDVKVGTQLSGGVDSSIVSYFANKLEENHLKDGISIIDDAGEHGEEFYIDQVGNQLNINLHKYKMNQEYYLDNYVRTIWFNDAPVYSPYFANHLKIAEMAKKHVTVTLSGEGADELTGGYNRFSAGIFQPFISTLDTVSNKLTSYDNYATYAVMSDATNTTIYSKCWENLEFLIKEQIDKFNSFSGSNFTKQIKFEMSQRLPEGLMRQDKMNMAFSIENRVPLLDNKFVDFVMKLPEEYLLRFRSLYPLNLSSNPFEWAAGKFFLKELCARKFGHEFAFRSKKIMVLNKQKMLSYSGFKDLFNNVIYPGIQQRGLLDAELIRTWFDTVTHISEHNFNSLWRAMSLEVWCQLFIDKKNI